MSDSLAYLELDTPAASMVTTVTPGVHWVRMPLPFALDHINMWLIDDNDGMAIVDTGIGSDAGREYWQNIIADQGRPVSGIVITHCHPDHIGQADWLMKTYDAPVFMTQGEYYGAHAIAQQIPGYNIPDMIELYTRHGLDAERLNALETRGNTYNLGVPSLPQRFRRMFDGDILNIGKHQWQVIVGYGHSPEHASLYCESLGVLISGDMLLPRISTNISVFAATPHDNHLGWFLCSLQRIKKLPDDTLVLPSHGQPFRGLKARIAQLEAHHEERCETLLAAMHKPCHAAELLPILFSRPLDTHQVMFAMGEAIAHLNYLNAQGRVVRRQDTDGLIRFERSA